MSDREREREDRMTDRMTDRMILTRGAPPHNSSPAPASDPLCDLYSMGFSPSIGHTMDQRADVRAIRQPMDPEVFEPSPCTYSSSYGEPVDFYDNDEDDNDEYDGAGGGGNDEDMDEYDDGRRRNASAAAGPPSASASASASAAAAGSKAKSKESWTDSPVSADGMHGHAQEKARRDGGSGRSNKPSSAFAMDMGLYVVSGVILIFLMEQFIQIGVRMR